MTARARGKQRADRARPIRVLWNQSAGRRRLAVNRPDAAAMQAMFEEAGLDVEVCPIESPDDGARMARAEVEAGARIVVAAGGDGTIAAVARELLDTEVALGIMPMGSIMNVPRMLDLPREPEAAVAVIARGATRSIDVGVANGTTFFETASVGMSAAIFRESHRFEEGDYGTVPRAIWMAFRYRPARMRIELDGGDVLHTRALMVSVANGPYMGMGMTVAPAARLDDGRFDVRVFRHFSKFELLRHLGSIAFGRRQYSPHVYSRRSAWVRIVGVRPLPVRADSQALGSTPLEVRVRPAALKVIVPAEESSSAAD